MSPHIRSWRIVDFDRFDKRAEFPVGGTVMGIIFGHRVFVDGESIFTSRIVAIDGYTITTESGSRYILAGPPSTDWPVHELPQREQDFINNFPKPSHIHAGASNENGD